MGEGSSEGALGAEMGQYPCSELETMELVYTIFPSQRDNQQITLPEGVAAPMTAPLMLVFSHHYVNATDETITISAVLNIETMDPEAVTDVAGLLFSDIADLEVPAGTDRVAANTCVEAGLLATLAMLHGREAEDFLAAQQVLHWIQR